MYFIDQLINGLNIGSIYALVALGYTMVYGIVKLINFAHGDIIMIGTYIIYLLLTLTGMHFIPAILISIISSAIVGMLIYQLAYRPLMKSTRISALITAIGVSLFLQNLFMLIFKSDDKSFKTFITLKNIDIFGVTISNLSLIIIVTSAVVMVLLNIFVKKTKAGKAMRAVSEDSAAASLMGINVNMTITLTFAIGSGLAAIASALYSSAFPIFNPYMGGTLGIKAFVAAVIGGIGIIPGAMLGGIVLGVVESLTKAYISTQLADAIVFSILIIVLIVKPSGILGKTVREKV